MSARFPLALVAALIVSGCSGASSPAVESATTGTRDSGTPLASAQKAVTSAYIPATDLETMNRAEFSKVVQPGPYCSFAYTGSGNPVLVVGAGERSSVRGVVKIHGMLVPMSPQDAGSLAALADGAVLRADGIAVAVRPLGSRVEPGNDGVQEAEALLRLSQGLEVGYVGFYRCAEQGYPPTH